MNMDLCNTGLVYKTNIEQGVELDYSLPDYCSEIFKVLKSKICTRILSYRIENGKIEIDGINIVTILYVGEEDNRMRQLEQRLVFSKTVNFDGDYMSPYAKIKAKTTYINCKVQNARKIDIRGAVDILVEVYASKNSQINADWEGIQTHQQEALVCGEKLFTAKHFTLKEQIEIGQGKTPIQDIISYEAKARALSYKILANKAICKGELLVNMLYIGSQDPSKAEWLEHSIPISRIIDFDGVDEDYVLDFYFEITKYDIDLQIDEDGECRILNAEIGIRTICEACKNVPINLVDDCYSTEYEVEVKKERVKLEKLESVISDSQMLTNQITLSDVELKEICHVSGEILNINASENKITYSTRVELLVIDKDSNPYMLEEVFSNEYIVADLSVLETQFEDIKPQVHMELKSISYHMVNASVCEVRCEVLINGLLYTAFESDVILDLEVLEGSQKQRSASPSMKVYFTEEGETLWDIAKRYNTTTDEIIEYNSIEFMAGSSEAQDGVSLLNRKLKQREIILIPGN